MRFLLPLLAVAIAVILLERILWMMFRRRMAPLDFPKDVDWSRAHFFSFRRLQLIALLHTIFLLAVSAGVFLFLW